MLSLFFISRFWKDDPNTNVSYNHFLESDGGGYYNYLPSYFIREDFGNDTTCKSFTYQTANGHTIQKYFVGTALMQLPFFLLASVDASFHYEEINGYEFIMQRDVALASFVYFILACYLSMRWLSRKFKSDALSVWSVIISVFSCGLFYYFTYEPFYSHAESFFLIALFLSSTDDFIQHKSHKHLLIAALSLGGIILVRPTNGLVILLLPFLAGTVESMRDTYSYLLKNKWLTLTALVLCCLLISIQPLVNYMQCGNAFEWGYKNEGFVFSKPKLMQLFFSFESGIFIYLPIFICILISVYYLFRKNKFQAISLFFF